MQPSSNIYRQLDTVLLLSQGHPIFCELRWACSLGGALVPECVWQRAPWCHAGRSAALATRPVHIPGMAAS